MKECLLWNRFRNRYFGVTDKMSSLLLGQTLKTAKATKSQIYL